MEGYHFGYRSNSIRAPDIASQEDPDAHGIAARSAPVDRPRNFYRLYPIDVPIRPRNRNPGLPITDVGRRALRRETCRRIAGMQLIAKRPDGVTTDQGAQFP